MKWPWVIVIGIALGMLAMWLFQVARNRDLPMTHTPWGTPFEVYRDSLERAEKRRQRERDIENQLFLEEQRKRIAAKQRFDSLVHENHIIQHQHEQINDRIRAMSANDKARYFAEGRYR